MADSIRLDDDVDFLNPKEECDLVMKGGVTSGIVYPQAIIRLAKKYRFRSLGGTSVGAIAATMTAAAELGRASGGFPKLRNLFAELQRSGLEPLFQPTKATQPLFQLLKKLFLDSSPDTAKGGLFSRLQNVLTWFVSTSAVPEARRRWVGMLIGVFVAACLLFPFVPLFPLLRSGSQIALLGWAAILIVAAGIVGWKLGALAGAVSAVVRLVTRDVPRNFFGMCTGRTEAGREDALTDWLHKKIQHLAGAPEGGVLTFSMLCRPDRTLGALPISLLMVTSNLCESRPYVLPFTQKAWLFRIDEFRRLFPDGVIQHLIAHQYQSKRAKAPAGYAYLPPCNELPVLVATRMSLSFPVLLCAVPLYKVRESAWTRRTRGVQLQLEESDLQQHWFSDGGIASNFPIHFFDEWFPARPTFGITLMDIPGKAPVAGDDTSESDRPQVVTDEFVTFGVDKGFYSLVPPQMEELTPEDDDVDEADVRTDNWRRDVFLPQANQNVPTPWVPLTADGEGDWRTAPKSIASFCLKIFGTAQNFRDNMQSALPSYRERIVQVRLRRGEGGLNLAMNLGTIEALGRKGDYAGKLLTEQFNLRHHQWVRSLVVLNGLASRLSSAKLRSQNGELPLTSLLEAQKNEDSFPYRLKDPLHFTTVGTAAELLKKTTDGLDADFYSERCPKPVPTLKVAPNI